MQPRVESFAVCKVYCEVLNRIYPPVGDNRVRCGCGRILQGGQHSKTVVVLNQASVTSEVEFKRLLQCLEGHVADAGVDIKKRDLSEEGCLSCLCYRVERKRVLHVKRAPIIEV